MVLKKTLFWRWPEHVLKAKSSIHRRKPSHDIFKRLLQFWRPHVWSKEGPAIENPATDWESALSDDKHWCLGGGRHLAANQLCSNDAAAMTQVSPRREQHVWIADVHRAPVIFIW